MKCKTDCQKEHPWMDENERQAPRGQMFVINKWKYCECDCHYGGN